MYPSWKVREKTLKLLGFSLLMMFVWTSFYKFNSRSNMFRLCYRYYYLTIINILIWGIIVISSSIIIINIIIIIVNNCIIIVVDSYL